MMKNIKILMAVTLALIIPVNALAGDLYDTKASRSKIEVMSVCVKGYIVVITVYRDGVHSFQLMNDGYAGSHPNSPVKCKVKK